MKTIFIIFIILGLTPAHPDYQLHLDGNVAPVFISHDIVATAEDCVKYFNELEQARIAQPHGDAIEVIDFQCNELSYPDKAQPSGPTRKPTLPPSHQETNANN